LPGSLAFARAALGFGFLRLAGRPPIIRADDKRAGLQCLLQQVRTAAFRTRFADGLVSGGEVALGIVRAAVENVSAAARLLLHQFALLALRALHSEEVLLHVLALRIPGAGDKLPVAPVTQPHVPAALRAGLVQRDVRNLLALIQPAGGSGQEGSGHPAGRDLPAV